MRPSICSVCRVCLLTGFVLFGLPKPTRAILVDELLGFNDPTPINTTAPVDDPGFYRVPTNRSAVYLGNQWVLTARHAGFGEIELTGSDGVPRTFPLVPGSDVVLSNPARFGRALTTESDLRLFRIATNPESGLTPEDVVPGIADDAFGAGVVRVAESNPAIGTVVTMISRGRARRINQSDPNGNGHFQFSGGATGFEFDVSQPFERIRTFGQNRVARESLFTRGATTDNVFAVNIDRPNTANDRDIIGQITSFDSNLDDVPNADAPVPFESQAAPDDSGGPVFFQENGQTVLTGVLHAGVSANQIFPAESAPPRGVGFGSLTVFTDLSQPRYRDQINALLANDFDTFNAINATTGLTTDLTGFSINGDVNLDGVVNGDGTGNPADDDVAAFVAGFGNTQVEADVYSWTRGDLNLDGVTDLFDFALLRDAFNGTLTATQLSSLLAAAVVPEPTAAALFLSCGSVLACRRSARRVS